MRRMRVYEVAKELGVDSKRILQALKGRGEFVRSASSPLEPPVIEQLRRDLVSADEKAGGTLEGRAAKPPLSGRDRARVAGRPTPEQRAAASILGGEAKDYMPKAQGRAYRSQNRRHTGGAPGYTVQWAAEFIEPRQAKEWQEAGVFEPTVAARCIQAGLSPADLMVRVDGLRLAEWIAGGEVPSVAASRIRAQRANGS